MAPLYQQVYDQLQGEILGPGLAIGDKFLSENQIVERFGVSKITARAALQMLTDAGYLSDSGRGRIRRVLRKGGEKTVLNIAYFYLYSLEDYLRIFDEFTRTTGIRVNVIKFSDSDLEGDLAFRVMHDADIDFMVLADFALKKLRERGLILPLSDFYRREVFPIFDDFFPNIFSDCRLEDDYWCLPVRWSPFVLVLNLRLARKYGLDPELFACGTFTELFALADRLAREGALPGGEIPFIFSSMPTRWPVIFANLGGKFPKNGGEFLTPENFAVLRALRDTCASPGVRMLIDQDDIGLELVDTDRALLYLTNFHCIDKLASRDIKLLPLPAESRLNCLINTAVYRFNKREGAPAAPELGDAFLKYMVSEGTQKYLSQHDLNLPVRRSCLKLPDDGRGLGAFRRELGRMRGLTEIFPEHLDCYDPRWKKVLLYLRGLLGDEGLAEAFRA